MNHPQTILTGDRPTGQLHLGHYVGSLRQRVALQHNHQQFILIADLQGLTDNGSNPQKISHHILEVMADYLAVGIDPRLTTICLQSALPALAELSALYMNIVTVARVERNPTVKNEIAQKGFARSLPVGFLAYPISQAADITAFKAELVPVGDDQLPMIEQTNEIVHKMNSLTGEPVLRHCKALLSEVSRLPGVDGNAKMSKSLGNTLTLSASEEEIHRAVSAMYICAMCITAARCVRKSRGCRRGWGKTSITLSRCMKTSTSSPACSATIKPSANCASTSCCRVPGWRRFAIAPPENSPVG